MAMVIDGFYKKINNQNGTQEYKFKDTALTERVGGIEENMVKHLEVYSAHEKNFNNHVNDFAAVQKRLGEADFEKFHFVYDDYLGTNGGVKLVFKD
jgi:hypothetical protein